MGRTRRAISSGSPLEPQIGFSRAYARASTSPSQTPRQVIRWEEAGSAHGERFGAVRPACTFVEVSRFIDPDWLVEVEVDALPDHGTC